MKRVLVCSEFYYPSIGGAQYVTRNIAEGLKNYGHLVEVATTVDENRNLKIFNEVKINEFDISGNLVLGMQGEIKKYQEFILNNFFDVIIIYAAQQWTFDSLWEIIEQIKSKTVFIPCGFSMLYENRYSYYYKKIPEILKKINVNVFHTENYRDNIFCKNIGLTNTTVIPNAVNIKEFNIFNQNLRKNKEIISLLTVASFHEDKGLINVLLVYLFLRVNRKSQLIINTNKSAEINSIFSLAKIKRLIFNLKFEIIKYLINLNKNKNIIVVDLDRKSLISKYFESDLFIFMSKIECSPIVLFESCAAGLPFITGSVGNANEIAVWTRGGKIVETSIYKNGYTKYNLKQFRITLENLINNKKQLEFYSDNGKASIRNEFNWDKIIIKYNKLIENL